jgi:hypothetical protein
VFKVVVMRSAFGDAAHGANAAAKKRAARSGGPFSML